MLSLPKINDSLMDHESPRGGFALVIALGLMAFVLILLLSITTLVQVETRSSKIQMQQMEAEQVALLGLQIAL
jgi:Tfp pilus assembly protein PilX